MDSDLTPVRDPSFLFGSPQYVEHGAMFWSDHPSTTAMRMEPSNPIWEICEVPYTERAELESGQIVLDKSRCWDALSLTMWYNEQAAFFYRFVHGDKDTFGMAFRKVGKTFYQNKKVEFIGNNPSLLQYGPDGKPLFQHRTDDKWKGTGGNKIIEGFVFEDMCFGFLEEFRRRFVPEAEGLTKDELEFTKKLYVYCREGHEQRPMTFLSNGFVGKGGGACESFWRLRDPDTLEIYEETKRLTCRLKRCAHEWVGRWENYEKMPVRLIPFKDEKKPGRVEV